MFRSVVSGRFDPPHWAVFDDPVRSGRVASFYAAVRSGELAFEAGLCSCGGEAFRPVSLLDKHNLPAFTALCDSCGLLANRVRLTPESARLFYDRHYRPIYDGAAENYDGYSETLARGGRDHVYRFVAESLSKEELKGLGGVCEVGAAQGANLVPFHRAGIEVRGMDYDTRCVEIGQGFFGRDRFASGGPEEFADSGIKPGLLILNHVAEHFLDFGAQMAAVSKGLGPGSLLFMGLPGLDAWTRKSDMDFRRTVQLAHTYYFTPPVIARTMASLGYELVRADDRIDALFRYTGRNTAFEPDPDEAGRTLDLLKANERAYVQGPGRRTWKGKAKDRALAARDRLRHGREWSAMRAVLADLADLGGAPHA